ncbi:MAG: ParB/Srx family N-terminal domain-containing protein [Myxococcota bacterium]
MDKGTPVKVQTQELSPTQACIGRFEVRLKADRFKLMAPSAVQGYLEEKRDKNKGVRVVKGARRFYVVDGHHTLSAVMEAQAPRELILDQVDDLSDSGSKEEFWKKMGKRGLYYPRRLGQATSPSDFPPTLDELEDDAFRSLAWLLRKMNAFEDLKEPYQEFKIADFLRQYMAFEPQAPHEYELAALRAFELLRSEEAERAVDQGELPGVEKGASKPKDLLAQYYEVLADARAPRYYQ